VAQDRFLVGPGGELEVVEDLDPELVQAREVEVALILVKRLPGDQAGAGDRHRDPGSGQSLGGVESVPAAAPVSDERG